MLAYDYPLGGVLLTILWFVLWMLWIFTLIYVIADVFRSRDLRGIAKAVWLLFILFVPFIGMLVYVIVRGDDMSRSPGFKARDANEAASRGYMHLRG